MSYGGDTDKLYTSQQFLTISGHNLTLSDTRLNPLSKTDTATVYENMSLCYGNLSDCRTVSSLSPTLWVTPLPEDIDRAVSIAEALGIPVLIFMADQPLQMYPMDTEHNVLVFTISADSGKSIASLPNGSPATVVHLKSCNCGVTYLPREIVISVLAVFTLSHLPRIGLGNHDDLLDPLHGPLVCLPVSVHTQHADNAYGGPNPYRWTAAGAAGQLPVDVVVPRIRGNLAHQRGHCV